MQGSQTPQSTSQVWQFSSEAHVPLPQGGGGSPVDVELVAEPSQSQRSKPEPSSLQV